MNTTKITPLFLALIGLEIFLIFNAFYYLAIENNGGMALAGVISLIAAIFNVILIAFERWIVNLKGLNKKWIWIIELIIITCAVIYIIQNGISIG